jgi:hypothetical protein
MNSKKDPAVSGDGREKMESYGDVLPQQYYGIIAGRRRSDGARDLMLAVLEDGIRCYVTNMAGRSKREHRLFDQERAWIYTRGDRAPFSFETICETLDIEPDDLRRRLKNLSAENFRRRMRTPKRSRMVKVA